jgi:hypothetical protein
MPKGVEVVVDGGFATIDFTDSSLRGPGLARLIEVGGPEIVETLTREGPRRMYRVPEGNAREAGLIDGAAAGFPDGEPSDEWKLAQLKAFAASQGKDADGLTSKAAVLALINEPSGSTS